MKPEHVANSVSWDKWAQYWHRDSDAALRRSAEQPGSAFIAPAFAMLQKEYPDPRESTACVLGSGDNRCAFALASMGFQTTSVDISAEQLRIASGYAEKLALPIRFIHSDAAELPANLGGQFDFVLTSNGFFVWISDLRALFGNAFRILRSSGKMISYDVHPFQRPWKDQAAPLTMVKTYWDREPSTDKPPDDAVFEYHWTLSDLVNSAADSGLLIRGMVESTNGGGSFWPKGSNDNDTDVDYDNWHQNPRAGLPVWLTLLLERA